MQTLNSIELFTSQSGAVTARHVASGVLIHSAIDPHAETRQIARSLRELGSRRVLVIGAGLGYLEKCLAECKLEVATYEPLQDLYDLRVTMFGDPIFNVGPNLLTSIGDILPDLRSGTHVYIVPYVLALLNYLPTELAADLQKLHVHETTRRVYQPLIAANERANATAVAHCTRFALRGRRSEAPAAVVGAGPSLDQSVYALMRNRNHIIVVAASGACPSLLKRDLVPDWTIALEARNSVLGDIDALPPDSKVIAFSWTHPEVFQRDDLRIYVADDANALHTSGGTSSLTAADFAAQITSGQLYLIGMDLSDRQGAYAAGARREGLSRSRTPKFASMRSALETWIQNLGDRDVYHVVGDSVELLAGAVRLSPGDLNSELDLLLACEQKVPVS